VSCASGCLDGIELIARAKLRSFHFFLRLFSSRTSPIPSTAMVKDIHPTASSNPESLTVFNGRLFFSALDATNGIEPWSTDGTEAGTSLLKDINPGSSSSANGYSRHFGVFNNRLFFMANDGVSGGEMWSSDGTAAGTALFKDIAAGSASSSFALPRIFNNKLYFLANDGVNGAELWHSDGTPGGTAMELDIRPGLCPPPFIGAAPGPCSSYPSQLTAFDNKLFFSADNGIVGTELWKCS
jgi:ELWxxDGT repeat protein